MEINNFDRYIREKVREAEKGFPKTDTAKRERIWHAIISQLGPRLTNGWYKIAALILLLLLPSFWLLVQNTRHKRIIAGLNGEIVLLEKYVKTHPGQNADKYVEAVIALRDTTKIIRPGLVKIQVDTVQIVEYVIDTVILYKDSIPIERNINLAHLEKSDQPVAAGIEQQIGETGITEFFLTENTTSADEKSEGKKASMKLVFGSKPQVQEFSPAIGTKL